MDTQRFDELTVALARAGSRRGMLRGLAGGVLGALALNRSGVLAENDKPKKDDGITLFAKPVCSTTSVLADCPLCAAARQDPTCCDQRRLAKGNEDACGTKAVDRYGRSLNLNCTQANENCIKNGTCVRATCDGGSTGSRCNYATNDTATTKACPGAGVCCNDYTSKNFGSCVASRTSC